MGRWLIAFILGLAALGTVYVMWTRENARRHEDEIEVAPLPPPQMAPSAPQANQPSASAPLAEAADPSASAEGLIAIDEPWARAGAKGKTAAAYMLITNVSGKPDRIAAVSSPDAAEAVIHETGIDSNGVASMKQVSHVDLDSGAPLIFEPGGLHVMLMGLTRSLKPGDRLTVVFRFQSSGTLHVTVPILDEGTDGAGILP